MKTQASHRRWRIWLPLLAAAGFLALQDSPAESDSNIVQPVARPVTIAARTATPETDVDLLKLVPRNELAALGNTRSAARKNPSDLFDARTWTPPPPPPPQLPPSVPTAPPLPFTVLGKKLQDGHWEVYLAHGEFTYVVEEGGALTSVYRIESIQPPNMTLVYLPLSQPQTLFIGAPL